MAKPTPNELWQLARTPRFLLRALLALLLILAFVLLGRWQWERTQDVLASERAALEQVVAVDALNPLGQELTSDTVGRAVTADGQYLSNLQRIVVHRGLNGNPGVWVVTPLQLSDGSLIAVMRGWLPTESSPGLEPPEGKVQVTGVLQADESFYGGAQSSGENIAAVSRSSLGWGTQARSGFIMLAAQQPTAQPAPVPVPVPVQTGDIDFPFQNFFYAFQWWIFGLFVVAVYLRWLWLDAELLKDEATSSPHASTDDVAD